MKMRTCRGRYWRRGTPGYFEQFENGVFHQWGNEYEEFETGPGNRTIAIVELPDGRIVTPAPDDIQFTGIVEGDIYG